MVENKWLFDGYCSKTSKLGVLLQLEIRKMETQETIRGLDELGMQVRALTGLGQTIGCEIKAYDFLAVGPDVYVNEMRRDIALGVNKKIEELRSLKLRRQV